MSGDTFEFDDHSGAGRLSGTLHDPHATVGQVLTVQADKSIAAAPGGGSMPGGLASTDFLFTEEATAGVYTATFDPPDGCTVAEMRFYLLTAWACDEGTLLIGDADHADGWLVNLPIVADLQDAPYDPTNNTGNATSAVRIPNDTGREGTYSPGAWPLQDVGVISLAGGGVPYGASFPAGTYVPAHGPVTATLTTTIAAPPVVPTGKALLKVVYFAPVTAIPAVFA